jgi:hypothetical protein
MLLEQHPSPLLVTRQRKQVAPTLTYWFKELSNQQAVQALTVLPR